MTAYPSNILLLLAHFFVTAATGAHAITICGREVSQLNISGRLVCSPTGNPYLHCTCPGVFGINVFISCNSGETTLAQALPNLAGFVSLTLNTMDAGLFDNSQCFAYVKLPYKTCILFSPTGNLRALSLP
ncbi:uncharacterized protein LOC130757416 [Actinidia eriantha]|uniref:uncharacterized protein LOC130757416 n=1 Tax=Actinidia eriantha TaxID=165200 RepID=UPI00258CC224|nr:uncharacterized protein LOC130757416 [Actinidia eriantha]